MYTKFVITMVSLMVVGVGCGTVPKTEGARGVLSAEVAEAVAALKAKDPSIDRFFEKSYGYAVLPKVFKGAFWVGGAHGKGLVYEQGKRIGYCSMSQATLGFSFGGEFFREIIFFRDKEDLDRFRSGEFTFSAQATEVQICTRQSLVWQKTVGYIFELLPAQRCTRQSLVWQKDFGSSAETR
jgi:lipid-binding SYLF domain-containing protein